MAHLRSGFIGDLTNYHKNEKGANVKDHKKVWIKICTKCKEEFRVYNKSETSVRKCLKCKYE